MNANNSYLPGNLFVYLYLCICVFVFGVHCYQTCFHNWGKAIHIFQELSFLSPLRRRQTEPPSPGDGLSVAMVVILMIVMMIVMTMMMVMVIIWWWWWWWGWWSNCWYCLWFWWLWWWFSSRTWVFYTGGIFGYYDDCNDNNNEDDKYCNDDDNDLINLLLETLLELCECGVGAVGYWFVVEQDCLMVTMMMMMMVMMMIMIIMGAAGADDGWWRRQWWWRWIRWYRGFPIKGGEMIVATICWLMIGYWAKMMYWVSYCNVMRIMIKMILWWDLLQIIFVLRSVSALSLPEGSGSQCLKWIEPPALALHWVLCQTMHWALSTLSNNALSTLSNNAPSTENRALSTLSNSWALCTMLF